MGFIRGFTRDFFSSCAWFGSGFISNLLAPHLAPVVRQYIANKTMVACLAWVIAYLAVLVCSLLIVGVLSRNVKQSIFAGMDRAVGVLFGLFRGVAVAVCFCLALIALKIPKDEYPLIKESKLSAILFAVMGSSSSNAIGAVAKSIKNEATQRRKAKPAATKAKKVIDKDSYKPKKIMNEEDRISLDRIKDWIADTLAKRHTELPADNDGIRVEEQKSEPTASKEKAPYGIMSLMEARARRRAEKRAALLKREIRKRLDSGDR
jgi:uncharacterized membrane protein required for colicin V production